MTEEDLKLVSDVLREKNISILNTRAFKAPSGKIEITVGSIEEKELHRLEFRGRCVVIKSGEFRGYLSDMNHYLKQALKYCANDTQRQMV